MIPKIIHYCWFGRGEMPELVLKCVESWKKYLPNYEIIVWNEDNFDINSYTFAAEAYKERKFAFVADVCRLHALKTMGGIYLDTDVEFVKAFDDEILQNKAFTGFEDNLLLSSAIMGSEPDGKWINDLLPHYVGRSFYLENGGLDTNPNTEIITAFMKDKKSVVINNTLKKIEDYCTIYPSDYFCPKSWKTLKIKITPNTYCIHHFAGSWIHDSEPSLLGKAANLLLGKRFANFWSGLYRNNTFFGESSTIEKPTKVVEEDNGKPRIIPKIIHYCWFGRGEMPDLTLMCIESWKKYLPDYEIRVWNEDNFDVDSYQYASDAYKERKFAFVADVCRLHVLKNIGGIYMDTDVEFIKPLSDNMLSDVAFTGFEDNLVSAGIMGSVKNGAWVNDLLSNYDNRSFYLPDESLNINPITETITGIMKAKRGLLNDNTLQRIDDYCTIYPSDYFYPKSWITLKTIITPNTYCIHHFAASWLHKEPNFMGKLANKVLGKRAAIYLSKKYRTLLGKTN